MYDFSIMLQVFFISINALLLNQTLDLKKETLEIGGNFLASTDATFVAEPIQVN